MTGNGRKLASLAAIFLLGVAVRNAAGGMQGHPTPGITGQRVGRPMPAHFPSTGGFTGGVSFTYGLEEMKYEPLNQYIQKNLPELKTFYKAEDFKGIFKKQPLDDLDDFVLSKNMSSVFSNQFLSVGVNYETLKVKGLASNLRPTCVLPHLGMGSVEVVYVAEKVTLYGTYNVTNGTLFKQHKLKGSGDYEVGTNLWCKLFASVRFTNESTMTVLQGQKGKANKRIMIGVPQFTCLSRSIEGKDGCGNPYPKPTVVSSFTGLMPQEETEGGPNIAGMRKLIETFLGQTTAGNFKFYSSRLSPIFLKHLNAAVEGKSIFDMMNFQG